VQPKIRILLADDHAVVRQGLSALINTETDMEVVDEAENGRVAVELAQKTLPNVVIMDLSMPVLNGTAATREIHRTVPSAKVLVLSTYGDDEFVERLRQAGAAGFLSKEARAAELIQAIRRVNGGKTSFNHPNTERLPLSSSPERIDIGNPRACPAPASRPPESEERLFLRVLLVYEDLITGLRGRQTLERIVRDIDAKLDCEFKVWKFNLLREAALCAQAASEAAEADIVFLAAHRQDELPDWVKRWLSQWLSRTHGEPCALAVSLDEDVLRSRRTRSLLESLRAEALLAGVDVFVQPSFCPPQKPE
jgi:DNA-binding NarL/FixJ family response regulator